MRVLSEWSGTEPALLGLLVFLELRTRLANVIGLLLAGRAEVLLALGAPHSVHTHVLLRRLADVLPVVVLKGTHLALEQFYHIAAGAFHQVQLALQGFISHNSLQVVVGFVPKDLPDLCLEQFSFTEGAQRVRVLEVDRLSEALLAHHVIAVFKVNHIGEVQEGLVTVATRDPLVFRLHK